MNKSIILSGPQFVHLYNGELDHHSEAYYFLFLVCTPLPHQLHHLNLKKKKKKKWAIKKKTFLVFHQLSPLIMWESFIVSIRPSLSSVNGGRESPFFLSDSRK